MKARGAAVVGLGHSRVFRRADVPLGVLAVEAARDALADAGLSAADVDGLASNPDQPFDGAGSWDGINFVTPGFMKRALRLENLSWSERTEGIAVLTEPFIAAVNAVVAGACDVALVFRALHNPKDGRYGRTTVTSASGPRQFTEPYGLFGPTFAGLLSQSYLSKYGVTKQDMAPVVVNARANGLKWDYSYWRQYRPEVLSEEDYLASPIVSWPLSVLDCDLPVQGAAAFVITHTDRALDLRDRPAHVLATAQIGLKGSNRLAPVEAGEATMRQVGADLWRRAGVGPDDVDVANVYDGFSIFVPLWLEGLGFAGPGEGLPFVASKVAPHGGFPLNTSGGNLGAGRMHGVPHLMDGALQVMGESGERQVKDAKLSVSTVGNPGLQGAVLFSSRPS